MVVRSVKDFDYVERFISILSPKDLDGIEYVGGFPCIPYRWVPFFIDLNKSHYALLEDFASSYKTFIDQSVTLRVTPKTLKRIFLCMQYNPALLQDWKALFMRVGLRDWNERLLVELLKIENRLHKQSATLALHYAVIELLLCRLVENNLPVIAYPLSILNECDPWVSCKQCNKNWDEFLNEVKSEYQFFVDGLFLAIQQDTPAYDTIRLLNELNRTHNLLIGNHHELNAKTLELAANISISKSINLTLVQRVIIHALYNVNNAPKKKIIGNDYNTIFDELIAFQAWPLGLLGYLKSIECSFAEFNDESTLVVDIIMGCSPRNLINLGFKLSKKASSIFHTRTELPGKTLRMKLFFCQVLAATSKKRFSTIVTKYHIGLNLSKYFDLSLKLYRKKYDGYELFLILQYIRFRVQIKPINIDEIGRVALRENALRFNRVMDNPRRTDWTNCFRKFKRPFIKDVMFSTDSGKYVFREIRDEEELFFVAEDMLNCAYSYRSSLYLSETKLIVVYAVSGRGNVPVVLLQLENQEVVQAFQKANYVLTLFQSELVRRWCEQVGIHPNLSAALGLRFAA